MNVHSRSISTPSSYTGEAHVCDLLRRGLALRRAAFCKSFEGCRADGRVVLPNGSALAVQIKTTRGLAKGTTNQYKFQSTRGYEECLVICCAVSESKFWLIPGEALSKVSGLTISTGGKWDRYSVPAEDVVARVLGESRVPPVPLHSPRLFEPQAPKQRLEVEGVRALLRWWPIEFAFPEQEHGAVDCLLRAADSAEPFVTVQCKTAFVVARQPGAMRVDLSKLRKGKHVPYAVGDFELLCVHLGCDDAGRKYFFPSAVLEERGALSDSEHTGRKSMVVRPEDPQHWAAQYLLCVDSMGDGLRGTFDACRTGANSDDCTCRCDTNEIASARGCLGNDRCSRARSTRCISPAPSSHCHL